MIRDLMVIFNWQWFSITNNGTNYVRKFKCLYYGNHQNYTHLIIYKSGWWGGYIIYNIHMVHIHSKQYRPRDRDNEVFLKIILHVANKTEIFTQLLNYVMKIYKISLNILEQEPMQQLIHRHITYMQYFFSVYLQNRPIIQ